MTNLYGIRRFGAGSNVFIFPATVTEFDDNFRKLITNTTRLPGTSGGFDNYGYSAAPSAVGKVWVEFIVVAKTIEQMARLKDELRSLAGWGKQQLFAQPLDLAMGERWCNARVVDVAMPESGENGTHRNQRVRIEFEVPEARWYAYPADSSSVVWGDAGTIWDNSFWSGSDGVEFNGPGPQDVVVNYAGTAANAPIIKLLCLAGQTVTNPKIEHFYGSELQGYVQFLGTVAANNTLIIDCKRLAAKNGSIDVYDNMVITSSAWLMLRPGSNTLRVTSSGSPQTCTVYVQYEEAYY